MGLTVLSLFDGISCGMVALQRAGIEIDKYIAYEIEHNAIEISRKNYPDIIRGGDVTKEDFTKYKGKVDLLIGGSPCQNLCSCGDKKGLDGAESKLFFDYVRALYETEVKWFLLENNNSGATNVKYSDTEYYILTPIECERLQTLPDDYTEGVSNTQRYKAVGNGWTVEVIAHIFKALRVALEKGAAPVMLKERVRPERSYRNIEIMPEKMQQAAEEREVIKMQGQDKEKYEKQIAELKQLVKEKDKEIADMREEMQQLKNKVFNILLEKACG